MNCTLNVTEREYDRILQLNHDALVWKTSDRSLLRDLETMLGRATVREMAAFDECKMKKQDDLVGRPRIEAEEN